MGVLLKWKKITAEATYNQVRVYRASGETAPYTLLHTQDIADNSYYDPEGTGQFWYKIDFYDSVGGDVSELSAAWQGGTYFGYCTVDEIRQVTNLKTSDVTDTHLATMIEFAGTQVNNDMNIKHIEEPVTYIDEVKQNKTDGVNSTYYTRLFPIADANNDFRVTVADMEVYQVDGENNKTQLSVTQVNTETGEFKISTAPDTSKKLFVTYSHCQRVIDPVDTLVKMATIFLTASYAYGKVNIGKAKRFRMGNLTVFRDMDSWKTYFNHYRTIMALVNDRSIANIKEAPNMPADIINAMSRVSISGN
jgi:hypothetical protein